MLGTRGGWGPFGSFCDFGMFAQLYQLNSLKNPMTAFQILRLRRLHQDLVRKLPGRMLGAENCQGGIYDHVEDGSHLADNDPVSIRALTVLQGIRPPLAPCGSIFSP